MLWFVLADWSHYLQCSHHGKNHSKLRKEKSNVLVEGLLPKLALNSKYYKKNPTNPLSGITQEENLKLLTLAKRWSLAISVLTLFMCLLYVTYNLQGFTDLILKPEYVREQGISSWTIQDH